jgi:hypothetical protein
VPAALRLRIVLHRAAGRGAARALAHLPGRGGPQRVTPLSGGDAHPGDRLRDRRRHGPGDRLHAAARWRRPAAHPHRAGAAWSRPDAPAADHPLRVRPERALGPAGTRWHRRPGGARRGAPEHTGGAARAGSHHGGGVHRPGGQQRAVRPELVPFLRAPRPHRGRSRGSAGRPRRGAQLGLPLHLAARLGADAERAPAC